MAETNSQVAPPLRFLAPAIATGIGYYLAAVSSLFLTRGGDGIATLWPSSGILLAALLIAPRKRAGWHVAAATFASLAANLEAGNPPLTSIGFTVANMAESSLAVWLLQERGQKSLSFTDVDGLTRFCNAAIIGTMMSATIAASSALNPSIRFWFSWFSTDLLGILVVTPLILIVSEALSRVRFRAILKAAPETIGVFGMVAIAAGLAFWQPPYPLLFLPMLMVIIAAFRLGPLGAAGGVLIVATISTVAMSYGASPHLRVEAEPLTPSLFLQFYLLMLFVAALPIASLLAARHRLVEKLGEKMRLLQLAEGAARVGHWRLDIATQTVTWSREVFRIHGVDGDVPPSLDTMNQAYHEDDRGGVTAHFERSLQHRHGFEFTARIVRPDGEVRHVFSRGEIDRIGEDGSFGLFGIIQDITAQVAHETAIEAARARAEEAAREARIMAETDLLTGIANRRRTVFILNQAVVTAQQTGRPMSVAVFDIDHFKRINDTYGHQSGDEVLKRVADNAAGELRSGDTLGRFGGEEFVIVLPDATAQAALLVSERVRHAIDAGGSNPCVTISIGVAELAIEETWEGLLRRADEALYVAKRDGRNMLRLAA